MAGNNCVRACVPAPLAKPNDHQMGLSPLKPATEYFFFFLSFSISSFFFIGDDYMFFIHMENYILFIKGHQTINMLKLKFICLDII